MSPQICCMKSKPPKVKSQPSGAVWFLSGQVDGSGPIRRIEVSDPPLTVGRQEGLGLTLPSASVSKSHAQIFEHAGDLWVRDLGSTNGTYVNGKPVETAVPLAENDILQFAKIVLRVGRDSMVTQSVQTVCHAIGDQALSLVQFDQLIQDESRIVPFFQPIVSICADGYSPHAYEVLGRSSLDGLTMPAQLFETAAKLNLETELSRIFRHQGLAAAARLDKATAIYLNTHPRELETGGLFKSLRELRAEFPEQHVVLEIHEAAVTDSDAIGRLRDVLTELDMGLAFDDFGAGQARLVELSEVQPDCLKFDMKLVQGIGQAPASRQQVVGTLIKMVNDLGIVSLVEGVESEEDHRVLQQMGAQLGQGFLYGYPASVEELLGDVAPSACAKLPAGPVAIRQGTQLRTHSS